MILLADNRPKQGWVLIRGSHEAHDTPGAHAQAANSATPPRKGPLGQIVLVLQGGGALGAYQAGVYQGLSEAGIEPDWVIGTSIGAINAAIIAGNRPADRLDRLTEFWERVQTARH